MGDEQSKRVYCWKGSGARGSDGSRKTRRRSADELAKILIGLPAATREVIARAFSECQS